MADGKKILIVEDDTYTRELYEEVLKEEGFEEAAKQSIALDIRLKRSALFRKLFLDTADKYFCFHRSVSVYRLIFY